MLTSCTSFEEEENTPYLREQQRRITSKVVSCLKIPLTSMCVVVRTSFPGSRLRQFFPTSLPHELVFKSIEETLLQAVLKSFITVFIHCKITNKSFTIRLDYIYILLFLESNISTLMIYKQTYGCTFFHWDSCNCFFVCLHCVRSIARTVICDKLAWPISARLLNYTSYDLVIPSSIWFVRSIRIILTLLTVWFEQWLIFIIVCYFRTKT